MAQHKSSPRAEAYKFLQHNKAAFLATVTKDGRPHAATINYLVDKKLNIYFVTDVSSRKYLNLIKNPHVALTISRDRPKVKETLQLSGRAKRIDDLESEQKAIESLWRKIGSSSPVPFLILYNHGKSNELALVKVTPYEMTIGRFSSKEDDSNRPLFTKVIAHRKH